MDGYTIKALGESTWDDFAAMVGESARYAESVAAGWAGRVTDEVEDPCCHVGMTVARC